MKSSQAHHNVYVIELHREVLAKRRFRVANPDHDPAQACVYVGLTGMSPEQRFQNHMSGVKAARLVRKYGMKLRPDLYQHLNPMSYETARQMEIDLTNRLRERGFAAWQN